MLDMLVKYKVDEPTSLLGKKSQKGKRKLNINLNTEFKHDAN